MLGEHVAQEHMLLCSVCTSSFLMANPKHASTMPSSAYLQRCILCSHPAVTGQTTPIIKNMQPQVICGQSKKANRLN